MAVAPTPYLTSDDIYKFLLESNINVTPEEATLLLRLYDSNQDDKLSFGEYSHQLFFSLFKFEGSLMASSPRTILSSDRKFPCVLLTISKKKSDSLTILNMHSRESLRKS